MFAILVLTVPVEETVVLLRFNSDRNSITEECVLGHDLLVVVVAFFFFSQKVKYLTHTRISFSLLKGWRADMGSYIAVRLCFHVLTDT